MGMAPNHYPGGGLAMAVENWAGTWVPVRRLA
jgi:hypothetical protein